MLQVPYRRRKRRPWLPTVLIVGLLAVAAVLWLKPRLTPQAAAEQTATPSPVTTGTPTATHPPSPTATLPATSQPTPTPGSGPANPIAIEPVDVPSIEEKRESLAWQRAGIVRQTVITYTVQPGDNVWGIAKQFDLDIETLRWSNEELARNPDLLRPGQELIILPVKGAYHTVQAGETVDSVAALYGVAPADITNFPLNEMASPYRLRAGQKLIIPHGRKEFKLPRPDLSPDSPFAWPIAGRITQHYSDKHKAIDIGAPYGSSVYAGREGRVIRAGWTRTGYGYTVIIDHGDGLWSLYSHMKGTWVRVGQKVTRGQLIGEVGSTGNSSGPHVHFEVRVDKERVDPLGYLPPEPPH